MKGDFRIMATINGLNLKVTKPSRNRNFVFDDIADGVYDVEISYAYPWKEITKDTKVWLRDEDNKLIKDASGNRIETNAKMLTWYTTDVIVTVVGGAYDGISAKYYLSTHPNFHGSKMQFLIRTGLIDKLTDSEGNLDLSKLNTAFPVTAKAVIKHKTITVKDKETGLTEDKEIPYVSYFVDPNSDTTSGDDIDGI